MADSSDAFLAKAEKCLAGAESEYLNDRFENCANRAYYACFQAAIAGLHRAGIRPAGPNNEWGHSFVAAQFVGQLINRRKLYSTDLRDVLTRTYRLRQTADYREDGVTQIEAARTLRRARALVAAVRERS